MASRHDRGHEVLYYIMPMWAVRAMVVYMVRLKERGQMERARALLADIMMDHYRTLRTLGASRAVARATAKAWRTYHG